MTNCSERLHVIRASFAQQPHVWRTVLVPETFSLLQLHIVLQDLFGWRDAEYSFHIYHQSTSNLTKSNLDECPEIKSLFSSYLPNVVYQLVLPSECDGWIKSIAPGVYIGNSLFHGVYLHESIFTIIPTLEHTHPHDPTALFPNHEQSNYRIELFAMRILKDERVHKLKHVFEKKARLQYEFDPGVPFLPTFQLDLELLDVITSSQPIGKYFPIIVDGKGDCTTGNCKFENFNLSVTQKRLNHTHYPEIARGKRQCYLCCRYQHECLLTRLDQAHMLYVPEEYFCLCLDHESHRELEPSSEIQFIQAWERARDELLTERANFLSAMVPMNWSGLKECQWRESNDEPCAYCS